jgi:hypothetical protein
MVTDCFDRAKGGFVLDCNHTYTSMIPLSPIVSQDADASGTGQVETPICGKRKMVKEKDVSGLQDQTTTEIRFV